MARGEESGTVARADGVPLAYRRLRGRGPGVVFLGGFRSDMTGQKAEALAAFCEARGQAYLRLDYSGHGASGGRFEDGTIGIWADDAALLIERLTEGPQILIGSSMGGWIALLLAKRWPERVAGLIGIAAAPDFTADLPERRMTPEQRATLMREGIVHLPSAYGDPTPITRALIEDGNRHRLVLNAGPIPLAAPVRLLHGQQDPDVDWRLSLRTAEAIASPDVQIILVKDGDHRLSRPQDLTLLTRTLDALLSDAAGG
ncbi:MAG: alpha/beta hydrolase [Acetobacteraceae bacterium]|nr:alpha/beta hydrolase [Acetobacteraceae bacterium]